MKGQVRTSPPEFLENELVIASLDGYGRLQVSIEAAPAGGDASAAKQDEIIALLESVKEYTRAASQYALYRYSPKYNFSDLATLADLTALTPPGLRLVAVSAERVIAGGVIHLHSVGSDPGDYLELNFNSGWQHYGQWDAIGPSTSAGCFPLRLLFIQ